MLRSQPNARVHGVVTIGVVLAGLMLPISRDDWLWLLIAIVQVWIAEGLNTAIEKLADAVHPEQHPLVGQAKDVAAGSVLLAALAAAIIGAVVLGPPLFTALFG